MIFSSIAYLNFFAVVLLVLAVLPWPRGKKGVLLAASYFFYGYWDYRFLLLLFSLSLVNYLIGRQIDTQVDHATRKRWLIAAIVCNLATLGFFKYCNFFIDSANALASQLGVRVPALEILLPVGISFITFEVMSYAIDIYRRENTSAKSFWDLALLVAFFPHLIAGPILKPRQFLPQLQREIVIRRDNLSYGLQIFLLGLLKKVVIADNLATFVDPVFQHPGLYSAGTLWLGVIAYAIQIYCDFSGYSDMAIGSAKCLGFDIPRNFNVPYVSRNITEFWRRWHISLSTWLRDYLYIPLGGNRLGKRRQYLNLFIVMLLGGLWHGASWNFVVWGGLHGIGLAVHKLYAGWASGTRLADSRLVQAISWLLTFAYVCLCWVFFRAGDFTVSTAIVRRMLLLDNPVGITWYATSLLIILPFFIASHYAGRQLAAYPRLRLTTFTGMCIFFFLLLGILYLSPSQSSPFIYFQF